MADASGLRTLVRREAARRHDLAARRMVNELSEATPVQTGRLERARRRRDSRRSDVFVATITQPAGAGEPAELPEWLDEGVEFTITARPGGKLRFRPRGSGVIFRQSVRWRPRPESVGFWSNVITLRNWRKKLRGAGR